MKMEPQQQNRRIFQEDVYSILEKGLQGEKYRKQNTDEAIRRILQDERLLRLLRCLRETNLKNEGIYIRLPKEILRVARESKNKLTWREDDFRSRTNMTLKKGSLELTLGIDFGYSISDYDGGSEWKRSFYYEVRAPIILATEYDFPVVDFSNPVFNQEGMEFYLKNKNNPQYDRYARKRFGKVIILFNRIQKAFFRLKGERIRASDLIETTGKEILEGLGEQIERYRQLAELSIGEVK